MAFDLRRRRGRRPRRRWTTATVAAPATKLVAASAAAWRAGTSTGSGAATVVARGRYGQAVDDFYVLMVFGNLAHEPHSMTDGPDARTYVSDRGRGAVPNTLSQYGALTPKPLSSSWKWWRMCSSRSRFPTRLFGVWWCTAKWIMS